MARFQYLPAPRPEGISQAQWSDWTWQLRHSLRQEQDFETQFPLMAEEQKAFREARGLFNIRVTPYSLSLLGKTARDPLRRLVIPHSQELEAGAQQMLDPLGEKKNSPVPRLIHRYSDRVLLLVTDFCSVYCRFCTRKHFTGQEQALIRDADLKTALNYIKARPGLREVLLSGGDPLTLSDSSLEKILGELRRIEHVELIRIGSRMPVVAPMRVTPELVSLLRGSPPVYMMTHFNHPRELTAEAAEALGRLVDGGIPVFNQMVLLNGVNNHPALIQALSRRLLHLRVKPYYMFQCDPSLGTDHLRTGIDESLRIQRELWGHLSGLAMPVYAVDLPGGGGKTVLAPNFQISQEPGRRSFRGWDGVSSDYVDPDPAGSLIPEDAHEFEAEWQQLKAAKKPDLAKKIPSGDQNISEIVRN